MIPCTHLLDHDRRVVRLVLRIGEGHQRAATENEDARSLVRNDRAKEVRNIFITLKPVVLHLCLSSPWSDAEEWEPNASEDSPYLWSLNKTS
jgi:hypothetical protein